MTSTEFTIPMLPAGGQAVTIERWLKRPGDTCRAGDPLLIVLNDRAELALPAALDGRLEHLVAAEGSQAAPGMVVATFAPFAPAPAPQPVAARTRATPLARRIAASLGIPLGTLAGSGPAGCITKADVLAAVPAPAQVASPAAAPAAHIPQVIRSPADTNVLTVVAADMTEAAALCARLAPLYARRGLALDLAACVAHAAAGALLRFPLLNGWWAEEQIVLPRRVQLAFWLGARQGVVPDAQDLNLQGFARALAGGHAGAAAAPPATFSLLAGGDAAWLTPAGAPNTAALALGAARRQPIVLPGDRLGIRLTALLALAYDARFIDQAYADAFLNELAARLARPAA